MPTLTPNFNWIIPVPLQPIDANTWGTTVNNVFGAQDTYLESLATTFYGPSAPGAMGPSTGPGLQPGMMWANTNFTPTQLQIYSGTAWCTIGTISGSNFTPSSGAGTVNVQTFTTSGTYTPSAGMTQCIVEVIGGGGGGGGSYAVGGGGGGGGGYARGLLTAVQIGVSQVVTIGAGGAGAASALANGSAGGTTSLGSLITATGGGFGYSNNNANNFSSPGGLGGVGSLGSVNIAGGRGITGTFGYVNVSLPTGLAMSGAGGSSSLGAGGANVVQTGPANQANTTGGAAPANGGGGGGGGAGYVSPGAAGGAGGSGIMIITEYL